MPASVWVPCESPPDAKASKAKKHIPWFLAAEHFSVKFFRAGGSSYARVINKGEKPKGGSQALKPGETQWYIVDARK